MRGNTRMVNIMVMEYTWSDGSKYEGEFKEGIPNGQGENDLF